MSRHGAPWLRTTAVVAFLFLYLPIVTLIILSFNASGLPTSWGGFSFEWYGELVRSTAIRRAFGNTLLVATAATAVATVLGTMLALGIERFTRGAVMESISFLPLIIPDIVMGIAALSAFSLAGFSLGLGTVTIAHVTFGIAFVAAIVRTRLRGFDRSLEEASRDLGAGAIETFLRVTLPVILPGIVAGALVAFTLSMDEFVIAFFTAGLRTTFPIQVYSMIRFGVTPEINAAATLLVALSLVVVLLAVRFAGPRRGVDGLSEEGST
jgi:spermidine/putrescine transport system permease protein